MGIPSQSVLTGDFFDGILRSPDDQADDEPLMITVGGILGGVVGELQVLIIERFGH